MTLYGLNDPYTMISLLSNPNTLFNLLPASDGINQILVDISAILIVLSLLAMLYILLSWDHMNKYVPTIGIIVLVASILWVVFISVSVKILGISVSTGAGIGTYIMGLTGIVWIVNAQVSGILSNLESSIQNGEIKTAAVPDGNGSEIEKIVKLKGLMDSGAITREEFEELKQRALGTISPVKGGLEKQLAALKSLMDSGALTQAEYAAEKKKLLDKI